MSEALFERGLKDANDSHYLDRVFGDEEGGRLLALQVAANFLEVLRLEAKERKPEPPTALLMELFLSAFTAGFACGENAAGAGE